MRHSSYEYNRAWKAKRRARGLTAEGRPYIRGPYQKRKANAGRGPQKTDAELDELALRDLERL
jgi:hypothetical protein